MIVYYAKASEAFFVELVFFVRTAFGRCGE